MSSTHAFAPSQPWGSTTYHGEPPVARDRGSSDSAPSRPRSGGRKHLAYAPGLDGVRAIAVSAVVVFHLGAGWLAGGFLGVDVFFTLSGFLITSILLTEFHDRGRIDIRTFYVRRGRRLLPALFTMLAAITLLTRLFAGEEMYRLRGDVAAALTYCTNWTQIAWNRGYFDQLGRPSLLQHLWSLAVEEQFYFLWPLLLVACLAARRWVALAVPVALVVVSLLLMGGMFRSGQDPARVYYGSDTHISPMLIGAVLAIVVAMRRRAGRTRDTALGRGVADLFALTGIVGLGWAALHVDYYTAGLYRGGYLFVGLGGAALIYAAARSGTVTSRLLRMAAPVWIGQRSYAIYLWHWPILMLTRPKIDVALHGPVLIVLQVAAIVAAADLSFRLVERPIRSRGFLNVLRGRTLDGRARPALARPVTVAAISTTVLGLIAVTLMTSPSAAPAGIQLDHSDKLTITVPSTRATPTPALPRGSRSAAHQPSASSSASASSPKLPPFARPVRVSFFGDSQGMTLLLNKPDGLAGAITVSDSTVEGCGVLLGVIHSRTGYTRDLTGTCQNWPATWASNMVRNRPQIAVVEIGAWDVFDDTVDGRTLRFGSPGWDAYFSRQMARGIRTLTKAGAQVALMGVPCYRPIAAGGLPLLPERGDDDRTRHVTSLLVRAADQDPQRVFMLRPPPAFCKNPTVATDTNYRWDGTHYYKPGAALVFRVITPQLLAIPQPPPR